MLNATIFTLTSVGVPIAFWSTRYFTAKQNVGRVKSSVDDLIMERGTVSMRVAFVLRSAEVQPPFRDLCDDGLFFFPSFGWKHKHVCGCQFSPTNPICSRENQNVLSTNTRSAHLHACVLFVTVFCYYPGPFFQQAINHQPAQSRATVVRVTFLSEWSRVSSIDRVVLSHTQQST